MTTTRPRGEATGRCRVLKSTRTAKTVVMGVAAALLFNFRLALLHWESSTQQPPQQQQQSLLSARQYFALEGGGGANNGTTTAKFVGQAAKTSISKAIASKGDDDDDLRVNGSTAVVRPARSKLETPTTTLPRAVWRDSATLPQWTKDYMQWHQDARYNLTHGVTSWRDYNYLVFRCLRQDEKCGGAADRLKPLPLALVVAHRLHRLLFYVWERPAPLQAFLVPPVDGLDWTWPPHPSLQNYNFSKHHKKQCDLSQVMVRRGFGLAKEAEDWTNITPAVHPYPTTLRRLPRIATFRFQNTGHGAQEYNQITRSKRSSRSYNDTAEEPLYDTVFADLWHSVFGPSLPVQARIDASLQRWHLQPNQYHAIHVRSQYHIQFPLHALRNLTQNAVHCLYALLVQQRQRQQPVSADTPIFVGTDNPLATRLTTRYAAQRGFSRVVSRVNQTTDAQHQRDLADYEKRWFERSAVIVGKRVVQRRRRQNNKHAALLTNKSSKKEATTKDSNHHHDTSILHLDRGASFLETQADQWTQHAAEAYYDTFVDMYLLSMAQCIVFNVGNYGKWANLISSDPSCQYSHMKDKSCSFPADAFHKTSAAAG